MNSKRLNFLLVEHGGDKKEFTIKTLKDKGLEVFLACTSVPNWVTKYLPKENILITDTYNSVKLVADVVSFFESKGIKLDAIGAYREHVVTQTADLAQALGLIGLNPGAARRSSNNKLLMRIFCRKAGIPTPQFRVIRNFNQNELEKAINKIGLPCVIKPIFGAESYGTIKVEKGFIIKEIIEEVRENTTADKKETFKNFTGILLVEEYLPGKVVSVDGLVQNKRIMIAGMVEFIMGPEPRFTQEANYIPPRLEKKAISECHGMAKSVIRALGFDNCGFHCELRITPKGPILLEIAARLPGGPLQPGYLKAHSTDLTSLLADIWIGKKVSLKPKPINFVYQKAVFPRSKGKIVKISGLQKASKIPGVWSFHQIVKTGESCITYPDIPKPFYYYAISAKSFQDLEKLSKKVESTVKVQVE